jgi:hypothetical protein
MSFGSNPNKGVGHCRRCGRELTDPKSIKKGIGPECEKNEQLHGKPIEPAKLREIIQKDDIWFWIK